MLKKICLVCLGLSLLFSCSKKEQPVIQETETVLEEVVQKESEEDLLYKDVYSKVCSYVKDMPVKEKISQLLIVGIDGNQKMMDFTKDIFAENSPGAFLFFGTNISKSEDDVINFTDSIFSYFGEANRKIKPFLMIDQEGGYVNRLKNVGIKLPSCKDVGEKLSYDDAVSLYDSSAKVLKALGFNVNLSPVLEVETDENKDFLDSRSFGEFEKIVDYGSVVVDKCLENNIMPVMKHFPGNSNEDPHTTASILECSEEAFFELHVKPFETVCNTLPYYDQVMTGILMSHAQVPYIEENVPACLSKRMMEDIIRGRLRYNGVIISDDIMMDALKFTKMSADEIAIKAIDSGVNMLMMSTKDFSTILDTLYKKSLEDEDFYNKVETSVIRIIMAKYRLNLVEVPGLSADSSVTDNEKRKNDFKIEKDKMKTLYKERF